MQAYSRKESYFVQRRQAAYTRKTAKARRANSSGIFWISRDPRIAPSIPVRAQAAAIFQSTVFNFQLAREPAKVMGMMRAREVPTATW